VSQSRFSIVLVGVSALLRRPLVSRLRPADGERSPWVVFAARGGRFDSGFRWAGWPSGSPLPLFGTHRFGVAAGRVGLRAHCFRFSACTASEWLLGEFVLPPSASEIPLGGLAFGLTASAFRHAPLRRLPFGGLAFGLTASEIPLGGLAFGFTASAFRHAPIRSGCWASSFFRLPFRRLSSAGWSSGSLLPLFGTHRFGVAAGRVGLRAHCFRFSARTASEIALGGLILPLGGWSSDSLLPLFGMRRSAPPRRRSEDRRSTTTRQLFHFKTLIPTC